MIPRDSLYRFLLLSITLRRWLALAMVGHCLACGGAGHSALADASTSDAGDAGAGAPVDAGTAGDAGDAGAAGDAGGAANDAGPIDAGPVATMELTADPAVLYSQGETHLTATLKNSDGGIAWTRGEPDAGTLQVFGPNAFYNAPAGPAVVHFTAAADNDPRVAATIALEVLPPPAIAVSPPVAHVLHGGSAQFHATVINQAPQHLVWSVAEPDAGVVDERGLFTAPASFQTVHVVATSQDIYGLAGSAEITVEGPATIVVRTVRVTSTGSVMRSCVVPWRCNSI